MADARGLVCEWEPWRWCVSGMERSGVRSVGGSEVRSGDDAGLVEGLDDGSLCFLTGRTVMEEATDDPGSLAA